MATPTTPKLASRAATRSGESRTAAAAAKVAQQARVMRGDEALTLVLACERQGGDRVQEHGYLTGLGDGRAAAGRGERVVQRTWSR